MTAFAQHTRVSEAEVLPRAILHGFSLIQREIETGEVVWVWQRRNASAPQFLTRRDAVWWMYDWLRRNGVFA